MKHISRPYLIAIVILLTIGPLWGPRILCAADWPQWGGSPARNNTPDGKDLPVEWNVGQFDEQTGHWDSRSAKNVLWVAQLGSQTYGTPVIAGGRVFCATNNAAGWLKRYPATVDLGCLLGFSKDNGRFLWQLSCEKLAEGRALDWPDQGICSTPLVEENRLWLVTNRGEVLCLDTEGSGTAAAAAAPVEPGAAEGEAKVIWRFDMMGQLHTQQHNMASCSVTAAGDLLLVNTSNGVDESHENIPAPDAPSFIALDKHTGKLVWADNAPGRNILHGQWSSPAFAVLGGVPQAIFPGGDGWVYSFLATPPVDGKPKLLWKFDCNRKAAVWQDGGRGDRSEIIATPVIYQQRVYIATGQDPEYGEGPGCLWCIDPSKQGDVSAEIVLDREGKAVPPRRAEALDPAAGETVHPNPNSAAVWCYTGAAAKAGGKRDFKQTMHRTLGMVAIKDDLLVIGDIAGLVHCLDAKTGNVHWTYDMLSAMWGSPLLVDGKIYIGDEDGDVRVFALAPQFKLLAENNMGNAVYTTPVSADNVLYISTRNRLFAIGTKGP
jgi:outer membrane protein assembly factor BamB